MFFSISRHVLSYLKKYKKYGLVQISSWIVVVQLGSLSKMKSFIFIFLSCLPMCSEAHLIGLGDIRFESLFSLSVSVVFKSVPGL